MENITNEIKAKVFAQYLGQQVLISGKKYKLGTLITSNRKEVDLFYAVDNVSQLILKPLSSITDEDAVQLDLITHPVGEGDGIPERGRAWFNNTSYYMSHDQYLKCYQYLQSKGYDLPNYLLGGKTLFESGLAIYE